MNKETIIKNVGLVLSVVGFGIAMMQKKIDKIEMDKTIANEVAKQLKESYDLTKLD